MKNFMVYPKSTVFYYIFAIFLLIQKGVCQNCSIFGVHQELGAYFQQFQSTNDLNLIDSSSSGELLKIIFMTADQCQNAIFVKYGSEETQYPVTSSIFFNSSQYNSSSTFSVWVHMISVTNNLGIDFTTDTYYTLVSNASSSSNASQQIYRFNIPNRDSDLQTILFTGNMDASNSNLTVSALKLLANEPKNNVISALIYTGNMAFNLETNNYQNGITFLGELQKFAAYWPLMATAGKVDGFGNFTFFNTLFVGLNQKKFQNLFYSFNLGKAHFIQLNMAYFFLAETAESNRTQMLQWLAEDLENANKSDNRKERPWIIVFGYYTFYCSNFASDLFCGSHSFENYSTNSTINANLQGDYQLLEALFVDYLVDLYISGANNSIYERLPPMLFGSKASYSSKISPDLNNLYIVNPNGPVYIVEGIGGNANTSANLYEEKLGFTLVQGKKPGYGKLTLYNGTVLKYEHFASNSSSDSDVFYLINTKAKWPAIWEDYDKKIFAISFIVFVLVGAFILIVFMLSIES